ncbi:PCYCGC motif-containing (lipo)protein [Lihuaxuella thermophila]|uniref:Lipoprotein n=1 Tax=Lihuaxuella thermophila TaxID=1173111 RepID=A0A1H8FTE1_9BACL|nr:PCYCGC motif-containing (lipo)protein [Lihuaxuella thermophila]SEN35081.1 Protein of unknown function with PCYCGC motif-containing protein [Lihuaxuella thermophila]
MKRFFAACVLTPVVAISLTACGSSNEKHAGAGEQHTKTHQNQAMSGDLREGTASNQLPSFLNQVDPKVVSIYRLAAKHPDLLQHIPCYCGCGRSVGHKSNRDCFIKEIRNGTIVWDSHAVTCYNCQQIALESIQLKEQGKSTPEIRKFIDNKYKQGYAEPTPTPVPVQ